MKIYIDLLLVLNFIIDFSILFSVSKLLRRKTTIERLLLSSFIGGLSILLVFFNINNILLIFIKLLIALIILIISFRYVNLKYTFENIFYFYLVGLTLGGVIYIITLIVPNIKTNFKINSIFLCIISPIVLYIYVRRILKLKNTYSYFYDVYIIINNKKYKYTGYLDTANTLKDPLTLKPVILLDKRKILFKIKTYRFIPYKGIEKGILKVIKPEEIIINNKSYKNILVGLIDEINIDDVDIILNKRMRYND